MDTGTWGLYYNYTWWGNAIQTASSVIGKPDFFGSQFLMLTSQQPNQVVNGNFATDSNWNLGTGWTINNGKLRGDNVSNVNAFQAKIYKSGQTYKITYTISDYVKGSVRFQIGGGGSTVDGQIRTANGTYTEFLTATSNHTSARFRGLSASGGFTGSIDNVLVQIVRADNVEAVKCLADWIHETQILDV